MRDEPSAWALRYAARGWPVLPLWWPLPGGACACGRLDCSSAGKHPLTRRGLHAASADPSVVERWWTRWPLANVGVRTGAASGLVVIDVDGAAGAASLSALVRANGPIDAAWAQSGSGGLHAYVGLPDSHHVPSSAGRLGPGLDVRAEGGFIVAPPSMHASGRRYRWLGPPDTTPAAPGWFVRLATPPPASAASSALAIDLRRVDRYGAAAIRGEAEAVSAAPAGTRNQRLNLAAWRLGRLVAGGLVDEATARDALLAAAGAAGLAESESRSTVRSGLTAGRRLPRQPRSPASAAMSGPTPRRPAGR